MVPVVLMYTTTSGGPREWHLVVMCTINIPLRKASIHSGIVSGEFYRADFSKQCPSTLHKSSDMHYYVEHKLVKNTLPSHHVKHDDTMVPPKFRSREAST
jgi:hypothetical protein